MAVIEAKQVAIGYEGKKILENLTFQVDSADFLCIVGENGAGKSTLMKTLLGLQKPLEGEICLDCKKDGIGYLPQQTSLQKDFPATVWEIVLSGNLRRLGTRFFYGKTEKERARKNMKEMDIWALKNVCFRKLSGGQQQRVLLARALCASDSLLFMDEPVNGLDPYVTAAFYELVREKNQAGMTVVMISHDLNAVRKNASHVLHIRQDGFFYGSLADYMKSGYMQPSEEEKDA